MQNLTKIDNSKWRNTRLSRVMKVTVSLFKGCLQY